MHRPLVFCILMVAGLTGCATITPVRNAQTQAKLTEANAVLDQIAQETKQFYTEAEMVRVKVRMLYHHPGWPAMQRIIEGMAVSTEEGGLTESQVMDATNQWNRQWNEPWQTMFANYLSLVKQCSAMELQRISLQSKILEAQAKYLGAAVLEYQDGRYTQGQSLDEIVEILGRSAGELDSYTVDSMGLYP